MKVGDMVRLTGENVITQVWVVTAVRSDSRAIWVQIDDESWVENVWHDSRRFEVVDGNKTR